MRLGRAPRYVCMMEPCISLGLLVVHVDFAKCAALYHVCVVLFSCNRTARRKLTSDKACCQPLGTDYSRREC